MKEWKVGFHTSTTIKGGGEGFMEYVAEIKPLAEYLKVEVAGYRVREAKEGFVKLGMHSMLLKAETEDSAKAFFGYLISVFSWDTQGGEIRPDRDYLPVAEGEFDYAELPNFKAFSTWLGIEEPSV